MFSTYFTAPAKQVRRAITDTLVFAGKPPEARTMLLSVRFDTYGGDLVVVATDQYRLLVAKIEGAEVPGDFKPMTLPREQAKILASCLTNTGDVVFAANEDTLQLRGDSHEYLWAQGDYPNWQHLMVVDEPSGVLVYEMGEMREIVSAHRKLKSERPVLFDCTAERVRASIHGVEHVERKLSTFRYFPDADEDVFTAYNPKFLESVAKVTKTSPIEIRGKVRPAGASSSDRWALLMPVKLPDTIERREARGTNWTPVAI